MPPPPDANIARDILSYFLRNPQAADDLEGLARWRLLRETIHRNVEETGHAIEWLVERGFLVKLPAPGSNGVFRLNFQNLGEAESFVAEGAKANSAVQHQSPDGE